MAKSLAHAWGQIVGDVFESTFYDMLASAAAKANVYLDYNGNERAGNCGVRNDRGKLAWKDEGENWHQLDFVFERGGTKQLVGIPLAFVEIAWRRYTKHSKNKAQEIEGALLPIAQTHRHSHPFLGAIVGGVFTKTSLAQLESRGFVLIYVPYPNVIKAFASVGIDASYDEDTDETEYEAKLAAYAKLASGKRVALRQAIAISVAGEIATFTKNLHASIAREIVTILVIPLHGEGKELAKVDDAIAFISTYADEKGSMAPAVRYEIEVRFSNGASIRGQFPTKAEATAFLRSL
jgi:hypothetical protein